MRTSKLLILALLPVMAACHKPSVPVTGLTVVPFNVSLEVGETRQLSVIITPKDASDKTIKWETSDASVVSVNDGEITALSAGSATVTATAVVGGKTGACNVTVTDPDTPTPPDPPGPPDPPEPTEIPAESVSVDIEELILPKDGTAHITATVLPDDTTDELVWSSSNPSVVSVDAEGNVLALAGGQATITATAGSVSAQAVITVEIPVKYYNVVDKHVDLTLGQTYQETMEITPSDATPKDVVFEWSVRYMERPSIKVDGNGLVTAIATGNSWCDCKVIYTEYDFDGKCYVRKEYESSTEIMVYLSDSGSHEGFGNEDWD